MERILTIIILALGLGLIMAMATALPAQATLGEAADSVARDQLLLSAGPPSTQSHTGYTVQELQSAAVTLREYISPAGIVFAIAWNGMVHPDLKPLLGSYSGDYESAQRRTRQEHGLRQRKVNANKVVVETWGHMRDLQGRSYAPDLIPGGVTIDEID